MKCWFGFVLCALFSVFILPVVERTASGTSLNSLPESPLTEAASNIACLPESEITTAVLTLSSQESYSHLDQAQKRLLANAERSPRCRKQVIAAFISAMDKPNLDLFRDQASVYLWIHGTELLSDLQATEALDLLISHLDQNDGSSSFPLNHYPAVHAVIHMGSVAIPN